MSNLLLELIEDTHLTLHISDVTGRYAQFSI